MIYILLCGNPHFTCLVAPEKKVKIGGTLNKSLKF